MFDQYIFSPDFIKNRLETTRGNLKKNKGLEGDAADSFVINVIAKRLLQKPGSYIDYGPYWWALKKVLADHGHDFGDEGHPTIEAVYRGQSAVETAIMADEFRTEKARSMFFGERTFVLGEGETMTLFDSDMEGASL